MQNALRSSSPLPVEIDKVRCIAPFGVFGLPAGRFLAEPFLALFPLMLGDAVVASFPGRLRLFGRGFLGQQLLQLFDLPFKLFDPRVALSEFFFQFGIRHVGKLRDR